MADDIRASWDEDGRVFVAGVGGRIGIRTGGPDGSGLLIDDRDTARAIAHAILGADRRVWPRLTDPPETVQVVRQTGGNRTAWTRTDLRFWTARGWPNGVSWAQVLRWGEVEDITDEAQGGGSPKADAPVRDLDGVNEEWRLP
jgi:hypothetical protein